MPQIYGLISYGPDARRGRQFDRSNRWAVVCKVDLNLGPTRVLVVQLYVYLVALGRGRARCLEAAAVERRRGHMGRGPRERALTVWLLARDDCLPTPSE